MYIPEEAKLTVVLKSEHHSISEARVIVDALDGLIMAGVWGAIIAPDGAPEEIYAVKKILDKDQRRNKASRCFFPEFGTGGTMMPSIEEGKTIYPTPEMFHFDPHDPMDAGVRDGLNSYLRRLISQRDPVLYDSLFSFATLTKAEHHSPLLIELSIFLGIPALPIVLTYGLAWAAVAIRKANAEADIRETEAKIREEELSQKKLQTMIMQHVESAVRDLEPEQIPKEAIAAASQLSTTSIADLSSKPLIGTVSLGITTKS